MILDMLWQQKFPSSPDNAFAEKDFYHGSLYDTEFTDFSKDKQGRGNATPEKGFFFY